MDKTQERALIGVSIGHAAHDAWFGVAPILLAALSSQMHLSIADIGLILLLYQGVSSVTQPLFGRLSERVGGRPLAVGAILWTTLMFTGTLFAESKLVLAVCITLAGLGSGAWHPQGAANATISGGTKWGATAASIFFLGGTMGMALIGSALGGYLLDAYGRRALLLIALITILLAFSVVRRMVPRWVIVPKSGRPTKTQQGNGPRSSLFWVLLVTLLIGTALRSLAYNSLNTYIPRYEQDLGISPAAYGFLMSLFLFGTAIGGVAGSYLADRAGLRHALVGSVLLCAVALLGFVKTAGLWSYTFLALTGLFLGPSHTLFVVAGQRRFPQRVAMVSGVFMGFTFLSGAVGAWLLGLLADTMGLGAMLSLLPWALVGAAFCALIAMPRSSPTAVAQEEGRATA